MGGQNLHGWHRGYYPESCQPVSSLFWEGSKPSGATYGVKPSNTKRHQGGSCAPTPTDLHVTFTVQAHTASYSTGFQISARRQSGSGSNLRRCPLTHCWRSGPKIMASFLPEQNRHKDIVGFGLFSFVLKMLLFLVTTF